MKELRILLELLGWYGVAYALISSTGMDHSILKNVLSTALGMFMSVVYTKTEQP